MASGDEGESEPTRDLWSPSFTWPWRLYISLRVRLRLSRVERLRLTIRARRLRKRRRRFERSVDRSWASALDWLDLVIDEASRIAERHSFQPCYPNEEVAEQFETLRDLHMRGLRIIGEIRTLLAGGHADAALANWRRLHELDVTMAIIQADGPERASAYRLSAIRRYRRMIATANEIAVDLGEPPVDQFEISPEHAVALETKHPGVLASDYAWAAQTPGEKPTFRDLERRAGLASARLLYVEASIHTHADALALSHTLAPTSDQILLVGAADSGLDDVGPHCAGTLAAMTGTFVGPFADARSTADLLLLDMHVQTTTAAFDACAERLRGRPARAWIRHGHRARRITLDRD